MTRRRLVVPGMPMHITQRGVDRCATFRTCEDFAYYRWALLEACRLALCDVHAYVLMTNHVHLLITPSMVTSPALMMQSLGRRYVRFFNHRYGRTGTLWEARYGSTLVDSARYLLECSRYIELNPVRAGMVADPEAYEWSSYRHNALGKDDPIMSAHELYLQLGRDMDERRRAYRGLFEFELSAETIATLRGAIRNRRQLMIPSSQPVVQAMMHAVTPWM